MVGAVVGFKLAFSPDYLSAAGIVSLLSVLVLVGLFFYLNRYTGRRYFSTWTLGWLCYAVWLALGLGKDSLHSSPFPIMLKYWCVGASAALLFWGSAQFLKLPSRSVLFYLFIGFLLVWSYVGAYHLKEPLQMRVPIFGTIGVASLVTAFSFYRLRKHQEFIGAGLLCFGFTLWGSYLLISPFFVESNQMIGTGFLIAAVLQLFIAVSMIILVLEEARAATELILRQIHSYEFEAPARAGRIGWEESQYHGLFDQSVMNRRLRAVYEDLRQAQERNLQRERLQALSQMSRGIAHDINNALTPILGYANLLLTAHKELPEGVLNYVRSIKNGGDKIAQSVACIRDFYRQNGGKGMLMPVEVNGLIQELIEVSYDRHLKASPANGTRVDLKTEYAAQLPRIMGQKSELREALGQLVRNSLEALPQGGELKVRTSCQRGGPGRAGVAAAEVVLVEVSDTGIGMDEETRKRCLEPFFSTKDKQGAKGLGLSQVFGVMQRHSGEVEIESEPGRGTTVRLVFPIVETPAATPPMPIPEGAVLAPLKILCVDDEPSVLDVLRILLKGGGHQVETVGEGLQAAEMFRAAAAMGKPFDLVVTDLGMPRMDGRELARIIKQESPRTPIIMVTGWGDIMKVEGNHPESIDAVLSKPPQAKELFDTLRKLAANIPKPHQAF
ncbi:MAG: Integral rane sensor hybrid histidine kinase [Pedosphaera sp.]|nr:Integral rane sensor hybrid histidine kinase [Pedosphaera sp.]